MAFGEEEIVLDNGIRGEPVTVPTANPTGFYEAISRPDDMASAQIRGCVFSPPAEAPWPIVIVVPGSLGVAPSHVFKAELLTDAGIAACVIDPFGGRGGDLHGGQPGAVFVRRQRMGCPRDDHPAP